MVGTYFIAGYTGFGLLLMAYILNLFEKIKQDSICFNVLNLFGALLLAAYTRALDGTMFPVLLSVWGIVAAYGIIKAFRKDKKVVGRGNK